MADRDLELLGAWRRGDATAADALLQRHVGALCRFFRNKIDRGIEDLIQQTLLDCMERRDRFPPGWSFRTFMFTAARDQLYSAHRRRWRGQTPLDPGVVSVAELDPSPSAVIAEHDEQRLFLEALRRVPLHLQIALELHYWEAMSEFDLSQVLDVPPAEVHTELRRGRALFDRRLKELASTPRQLARTLGDLDRWAASVRAQL